MAIERQLTRMRKRLPTPNSRHQCFRRRTPSFLERLLRSTTNISACSTAPLPNFMMKSLRRTSWRISRLFWMILLIISTNISSARTTSKTSCGISVFKDFSIVQSTGKLSCRPNTFKMVSLWNLRTRSSTCRSFTTSSSSQARWITRALKPCTHISLAAARLSAKIAG